MTYNANRDNQPQYDYVQIDMTFSSLDMKPGSTPVVTREQILAQMEEQYGVKLGVPQTSYAAMSDDSTSVYLDSELLLYFSNADSKFYVCGNYSMVEVVELDEVLEQEGLTMNMSVITYHIFNHYNYLVISGGNSDTVVNMELMGLPLMFGYVATEDAKYSYFQGEMPTV